MHKHRKPTLIQAQIDFMTNRNVVMIHDDGCVHYLSCVVLLSSIEDELLFAKLKSNSPVYN